MFDLKSYLLDKQHIVNKHLDDILKRPYASDRLVHAMRHSLMAGGKRLRPILCLAGTEAVGGNADVTLDTACALEMIHTYSLIHDDLPAMDNDELRRGLPTCHVAFDEATAILAGDALLTLAFEILSDFKESESKTFLQKRFSVIRLISEAAGYNGMIAGQMKDITSEGKKIELDALKKLHALKTGALIEASLVSGAILGNGGSQEIAALSSYGKHIGLAFQVADDILNIEGDPALMGKAVGTDQALEKSTYPSHLGLEQSKAYAENLVNNALNDLNIFNVERAAPLRAVARYIIERKK